MEGVGKDSRFSHITKDPRFRRMPKHEKKVKIDKRFKDMFTDKRFKLKYSVDKRGKPMNVTTNENLKQYYELSDSSDNEDEESDNAGEVMTSKISQKVKKSSSETDTQRKGSKLVSTKEEISVTVEKKKSKKNKKTVEQRETIKPVGNSDSDEEEEVIERKVTKAGKVSISSEAQGKAIQRKSKVKGISVDQTDTDEEDEEDYSNEEEDEEEEKDSDSNDSGLGEGPDLARGEGNVETSSSSEDEDSEEEAGEEEELDHGWGELDKDVPTAEDLGRRLAVCNMDWDRIKAQDIFVLLNSFVPTGGSIQSVKVFPSEFGLQRMKEEALSGPTELVQVKLEKGAEEGEGDEEEYEETQGTRYHREKLRQYQLNRLKYFYAVVETDSIETASKIYEECDGMEYESSSTKLDLRFIPDDMEFTEEPRSMCTEMPAAYDPTLFVSSALAQSKVNLTWDETDQDRIKVTMRNPAQSGKKTDDVNEEDFKAFLASSSEEEADDDEDKPVAGVDNNEDDDDDDDDNEENQIQKYRSLLQSLDDDKSRKKKKEVEMEVTWEPGLKEATEKILKKKEKTKDQTPWQQYLMKKKEKRQKKKEERMNKKVTSDQAPEEAPTAFSDDELPSDTADDPFFKQSLDSEEEADKKPKESKKKMKKKKKDKRPVNKDAEGELELLMMEEEADDRKHFNLKAIMKESTKKKKPSQDSKDRDDFQINVKDDRFGAIYDSYLYNIDPSAPEYKKTKSMEAIIEEKLHRRKSGKSSKAGGSGQKRKAEMDKVTAGQSAKFSKSDSESISSLINSVKSKTQTFHNTKKKK